MRLQDLVDRFDLQLRGNPDQLIEGVGTLKRAEPGQISFLANPAYIPELNSTRAGAVVLEQKHADRFDGNALITSEPYLAYARIAGLFDARPQATPGVHSSAVIDPDARLGEKVSIGPNVVVASGCVIGNGCTLQAGVVIGADCHLGEGCLLYPNVTLAHGVTLGDRVILHPGVVIGADGFGIAFAKDPETGGRWEKVPQLGGVVVGDDCEIGANSAIDRGAIEDTVLEEDVRIDNLVQIGHNVRIGAHTAIAGSSAVAGSSKIGRYCLLAGKTALSGHVTIADRTTIAAGTNVMRDIDEPGTTWDANIPARPIRQWQRNVLRLFNLEDLNQRVRKLQKNSGESQEHE